MQKAYVHIAAIISIFLFPVIKVLGQVEKIDRKDLGLLIGGAFFNPFLYFIGENYGLNMVSVSVSAIIIATIPVFTPFVGSKIFGEKLSVINIVGLIISFAGLILVLFNKQFELEASPLGIALLFLAVFSAVVYTVYVKKLTFRYKPITIIAWQNFVGAIFFLPIFLVFDFKDVIHIIPDPIAVFSLIGLGVLCSSAAYILFIYAIKHLGISKSNLYTNLIPVIATVAAYFILKEDFTWFKAFGIGVVIIGVLLSQYGKNKRILKRRKNE